jgi:hypothetical protein
MYVFLKNPSLEFIIGVVLRQNIGIEKGDSDEKKRIMFCACSDHDCGTFYRLRYKQRGCGDGNCGEQSGV